MALNGAKYVKPVKNYQIIVMIATKYFENIYVNKKKTVCS